MKPQVIQVLLVEDDQGQASLFRFMLSEFRDPEFNVAWVEELHAGLEALKTHSVDVAVLDLSLPDSDGVKTFLRMREAHPELPTVVLTGLDRDDIGIQVVQAGAQDFLIKGQVTGPLLARALRYSIERKRADAEKHSLITRLQETLANIRTLKELLPICAACRKIRDDKGYWNKLEHYLLTHTDVKFTHGLCPDCVKMYAPDSPPQISERL